MGQNKISESKRFALCSSHLNICSVRHPTIPSFYLWKVSLALFTQSQTPWLPVNLVNALESIWYSRAFSKFEPILSQANLAFLRGTTLKSCASYLNDAPKEVSSARVLPKRCCENWCRENTCHQGKNGNWGKSFQQKKSEWDQHCGTPHNICEMQLELC